MIELFTHYGYHKKILKVVIPKRRAISILEKINTAGSEPLRLICDDYETYYVKNHQLGNPASSIINEVLCHFLLDLWDINTPDIALINLEAETIRKNYGYKHKPSYYNRLAFGSKHQAAAFDIARIIDIKGKVDFRKYSQAEIFAHIGLFDMWVDNEDRGPELNNLMVFEKEGGFSFLAIDHAAAFRTGAYDTLSDNKFYPTEGNCILQSQFFKGLKQFLNSDNQWLRNEKEKYYLYISKCKQQFSKITTSIPPEWGFTQKYESLVYDFLFNNERNKQVFNEYLILCK